MYTLWIFISGLLTAGMLFAQPATVITITDDGQVYSSNIVQPRITEPQLSPADAIVEGDWCGSNDVHFTVLNQTTIDTFSVSFRNVGGCSKVTVKTSPVTISGGSFTISYNIPTISAGSLTGTFATDGRSCSGTFDYTNYQCGGSTNGSWTAEPETVLPPILNPPTNLKASLSENIITLNWQAPAASNISATQLHSFSRPVVLAAPTRRQIVSGFRAGEVRPPQATLTIDEIEPNNNFENAQIVSGPSPVAVDGNAEIGDQGALTIQFNDGSEDDVEDMYVVTTQSSGLSLTLSGAVSDLDLYLIEFTGQDIQILDASLNAGLADESIDQPSLAAGKYYIGVSIYDPAPGGPNSSPYQLIVTGDLGGDVAGLQHYNVYRSVSANPKTTGTVIGTANADSTTYQDDISGSSEARLYYQVTAVYENGESEPSNEVYIDLSPQLANDVGVTGMQVPKMIALGDTVIMAVVVRNFGTNVQSGFPVSYRVNNEPAVSETFTESLPAGESAIKAFSTTWAPSAEGTYSIAAWTALIGDQNPMNDVAPTPDTIVVQSGERDIVFAEDFESYALGSIANATDCPWVQLSIGRNCNISPYWVHGGTQNLQINSFLYNTEIDYVKFDLTYKPAVLSVSLWYSPDGYYVYEDFAEFGLGFVLSKFDMDPMAGFKGISHDLLYQTQGISEAINAYNELEFGRGPASLGQGTPKHNFLRAEFDFAHNEVRLYAGMDESPPLRSTLPFDGTLNCNAFYLAGGLNETCVDDITIEAIGLVTAIEASEIPVIPENYSLAQNYPNPFNPETTIEFSLPKPCEVTIKIYNLLGEEITTFVSEKLQPGNYKRVWSAGELSSGVYFYRLQTDDFVQTKKLLLLR